MNEAILVTRTVNCSELSKEQFISMMMEDLRNSVLKSEETFRQFEEERYNNNLEQYRKSVEARAIKFAESKWKTEKKRAQYVANAIASIKIAPFEYRPVSFFDFDLNPYSNGISSCCILDVDATEAQLGRCFEEIANNKYFVKGLGWHLVENRSFRPFIQLILPEEMEQMFKDEEAGLAKAISDFYKDAKYFGD